MYTIAKTPQARYSQSVITKSLFTLLEQETFAEVTITQICQYAEVSRTTFYRNFDTKEDIILLQLNKIHAKFEPASYNVAETNNREYLTSYYYFISNYKTFFSRIESNHLFYLFQNSTASALPEYPILPILKDNSFFSEREDFVFTFLVSTVSSVLSLWVRHDFKETPEELAELTDVFMDGLLERLRKEMN